MNKNDKGHYGELIGGAWLVKQGYWVFRNVAPHGCIDAVAIHQKTGKKILIDFKVAYYRKSGWECSRIVGTRAKELGVRILYVNVDTHECRLKDTWENYLKKKRKIKMEK